MMLTKHDTYEDGAVIPWASTPNTARKTIKLTTIVQCEVLIICDVVIPFN
jgi:hypothetical protein